MAVTITASVGLNGTNRPADVFAIQKAWNDIPASAGGASPKLFPDGQSGPKTRAAILHFQQLHLGLTKDSKVDPGGTGAVLSARWQIVEPAGRHHGSFQHWVRSKRGD